jgi:hypothetical protein
MVLRWPRPELGAVPMKRKRCSAPTFASDAGAAKVTILWGIDLCLIDLCLRADSERYCVGTK